MFPEETIHCLEWARDKFAKVATQKPRTIQNSVTLVLSGGSDISSADIVKGMRWAVKLFERNIISFEDCLLVAEKKFTKYFNTAIIKILTTYPVTHKTTDGTDFWRLPKRIPKPIVEVDSHNKLHCEFIIAYAIIFAKILGIDYPSDFRDNLK